MWNYRICRHRHNGQEYYALREIIYGDDGKPMTYVDHIEVVADEQNEIIETLFMMLHDSWRSIHSEIIDEKDFKEGGKYAGVTAKWVEDYKEMIDRVENGEERSKHYISADEMWEKFEIEGKKTHREDTERILRHYLKNETLPSGLRSDDDYLADGVVDRVAEATYESWHKDEEKHEDKNGA